MYSICNFALNVVLNREYEVGEMKFHVFSVQNSKNELFLILFGKICDYRIWTAAPKVFQGSNSEIEKEKEIRKFQNPRKLGEINVAIMNIPKF